MIERIRFLNDFDLRPEKRVSGDERPQRFVISASYQLPFGAGKVFDAGANVRTFPTQFGNLRQDGANNIDLSVLKNTKIFEKVSLQLRFEAFNAFNHPEFAAANLSPTSSAFGRITGQNNLSRSIQIGARLVW